MDHFGTVSRSLVSRVRIGRTHEGWGLVGNPGNENDLGSVVTKPHLLVFHHSLAI